MLSEQLFGEEILFSIRDCIILEEGIDFCITYVRENRVLEMEITKMEFRSLLERVF